MNLVCGRRDGHVHIAVPSPRRIRCTVSNPILRYFIRSTSYTLLFNGLSEMDRRKKLRNMNQKWYHPLSAVDGVNPAKRDVKRARIELAMLDFRASDCQHATRT